MRAALTSEGDAHTHAPDGASRRTASTAAGQAEAQRRHTHTRRAHVCTHKGVMAPRAERCVLSAVVPRPNRKRQPSCFEQPLRSHGSWPSCMSHGSWPSCIDQALRSHAVQAEQEETALVLRAATSVARLMAIVHVARLMAIVHRPGTSLARCPGRTGSETA